MEDNEFKNLIRSADKLAPRQVVRGDLASSVRQRAKRRTNVLRVAVAACVMIAAGIGAISYTAFKPEAVSMEVKVAQLQEEVELLGQQIEQLKSLQEVQAQMRELYTSVLEPIEKFNREVDDAAFAFLYQGDRLQNEMDLTDAAVDMYEQVIKISPDSKWARTAHQKILQIKKQKPIKEIYHED